MSDFQPLLSGLGPVADRFQQAGHQLHLVGGIVRDHLAATSAATPSREVESPDIDLTTDARPEVTRQLLRPLAEAIWAQGERFGTIGATVGGHDLEITTYRSESYVGDSRKPTVTFGDDLETDLSRRDFTINAMAVDVFTGVLVDPYNGLADLRAGLLRTPLDPEISFADDPLRILRAARFSARFNLEVAPELSEAARRLAHRLAIVSAERKRDELERLLLLPAPHTGLVFLGEHLVVDDVVPELADPARWSQAVGRVALASGSLLRRAALFGDLAPEVLAARMEALRYPGADVADTVRVVRLLPRVLNFGGTDAEVRRLVAEAGAKAEPELVDTAVALAALMAAPGATAALEERLQTLRRSEDLTDLSGPMTGEQVMAALGLVPGPAVGEALDRLRDHRIEHGPFSRDEALRVLQQAPKPPAG